MTRFVRGILWTVMGLAAFNLILPFVAPAIGFGMGPDPAFAITEARVVRHVIPDLIVIVGAWLMLAGGSRTARSLGRDSRHLGGWMGRGGSSRSPGRECQPAHSRLTYHSLTGVVLIGLAAVALGALISSWFYDLRGEVSREESRRVEL